MKSKYLLLCAATAWAVAACETDGHYTRESDDDVVYERSVRRVVVARPAPAPRIERRVTVAPNPNYVWIRGHWAWRNDDWVWIGGRWVERPRPGAVWREGEFLRQGDRMIWTPGHWSNRWVQG
jgi:hypothetical protein